MDMKIVITGLSHDDLVNLFSTATYGNDDIDVVYPEEEQVGQYGYADDDCYEDKIAKALLKGAEIKVVDLACDPEVYKEDVEFYGVAGTNWVAKGYRWHNIGYGKKYWPIYYINLKTLMQGLSHVDAAPYVQDLFVKEEGDMFTAYNLLQIAVFGEIIYG